MQYKNINNKIIVHLMWYMKQLWIQRTVQFMLSREIKFIIEAVSSCIVHGEYQSSIRVLFD